MLLHSVLMWLVCYSVVVFLFFICTSIFTYLFIVVFFIDQCVCVCVCVCVCARARVRVYVRARMCVDIWHHSAVMNQSIYFLQL